MRGDGGIGVEPGIAAHPDIALRGVAPRETWPLQEPAAARAALRTGGSHAAAPPSPPARAPAQRARMPAQHDAFPPAVGEVLPGQRPEAPARPVGDLQAGVEPHRAPLLAHPRSSCPAGPWAPTDPQSRRPAGMYATILGTAAARRPSLQTHPVHHPAPGDCALRADASRRFVRMSREMPETKNCIPKRNKDYTRFKLKVSSSRPLPAAACPRVTPSVPCRKSPCQRTFLKPSEKVVRDAPARHLR